MRNNACLQNQVNQWFAHQGEIPEWERSINPAGDILHVAVSGFCLLILDAAIEDNETEKIIGMLTPFLLANMHDCKRWVLGSNLTLKAQQ